jgi:hypothetical protein
LGEELVGRITGVPDEIFVSIYDECGDGRGEKARLSKSLMSMAQSRRYKRTHEEEDAIHVALPTFCEDLVILLALLENDAPELCGRIGVLDLCEYHFRTWLKKYLMLGYLDHSPDSQAGPLGTDLGFNDEQVDGGCPKPTPTWNIVHFELSVWLGDFWRSAPNDLHFYANSRVRMIGKVESFMAVTHSAHGLQPDNLHSN